MLTDVKKNGNQIQREKLAREFAALSAQVTSTEIYKAAADSGASNDTVERYVYGKTTILKIALAQSILTSLKASLRKSK